MMVTLQELTGAPIRLNVGSQQWQLTPLTLGHIGELERAMRDHDRGAAPSLEQLAHWIQHRAGTAYVLWLALLPRHPESTLSAAQAIVDAAVEFPADGSAEPDILPRQAASVETPACWAGLFRHLARRYGWTPAEIARLTLAQSHTLAGITPDTQGRVLFSRQEYQDWRRAHDIPSTISRSDPPSPTALRLTEFRQRLTEIYAPLSAPALRKLTAVSSRPNQRRRRRALARRPRLRRWTNADRAPAQHDIQLSPQINWHLHTLIMALRHATPPSDILPAPELSGARIARFQ